MGCGPGVTGLWCTAHIPLWPRTAHDCRHLSVTVFSPQCPHALGDGGSEPLGGSSRSISLPILMWSCPKGPGDFMWRLRLGKRQGYRVLAQKPGQGVRAAAPGPSLGHFSPQGFPGVRERGLGEEADVCPLQGRPWSHWPWTRHRGWNCSKDTSGEAPRRDAALSPMPGPLLQPSRGYRA